MRWGSLLAATALLGCHPQDETQSINETVAADAEAQYEMVEKYGSAIDKCVQAGLVAQAYLQTKIEDKYRHWKVVEELACSNAGVAR